MTSSKSYKVLQTELDEVLAQLQSADLDIDKALALYKQGQKLIEQLEEYLSSAKNEITQLSSGK